MTDGEVVATMADDGRFHAIVPHGYEDAVCIKTYHLDVLACAFAFAPGHPELSAWTVQVVLRDGESYKAGRTRALKLLMRKVGPLFDACTPEHVP